MEQFRNFNDLTNDTEFTWDYEESLEESLFDMEVTLNEIFIPDNSPYKQFKPGDIIMTNKVVATDRPSVQVNTPHRIYVISAAKTEDSRVIYTGYLLTSQVQKSNKFSKSYPALLFIDNYASILSDGPSVEKPVAIDLQHIYRFSNEDLSSNSSYKGHVNSKFIKWVDDNAKLYKNRRDMSQIYWISAKKQKEK